MTQGNAAQIYSQVGGSVCGQTVPTADEFAQVALERRVVPVVRRLLADMHTPVGLYRKLARNAPGTFLLESAENGRSWSRYSFIGVRCAAMLTERNGQAVWVGDVPADVAAATADGDPLAAMRDALALLHTERIPGLPPLNSGLVGMISYDAVRRWERLPDSNPTVVDVPEVGLLMATDLAVLDHFDGSVLLIANAIVDPATVGNSSALAQAHADAVSRLDAMAERLAEPVVDSLAVFDSGAAPRYESDTTVQEYHEKVEIAREHIYAGDAFQIVVSQRFQTQTSASALDVYRVLRVSNPSPYMYLIRFPTPESAAADRDQHSPGLGVDTAFDVVGSSPEALVKLEDGNAMLHPIAGTRPRGSTPEADQQLAEDLLADSKERAEHLMLVDLGRNDLGRVSEPGSVEVVEFMQIERYSHVMHIVSTVTSHLAEGQTAYDLLAATFPAGTLSGAPKPRAMEIIDSLETSRRGLYGGIVGYLDFAGDMDTAIAIRTAVLRDSIAYVQAGAGLVADSDAATEQAECEHKAAAVLRAIAVAGTLSDVGNE
ncbi:MAG: anthranilate synthase component I [Candidatus Nanopelagicales bacterium]|jgi:anthranilate synthase component 1